jgi:signal transduction histidine kinase
VNHTSSPSNERTIRSRLTRIVIVPSVVLLVLWLTFSGFTGAQALRVWLVGLEVRDVSIPAVTSLAAIQQERLMTMRALSQPKPDMTSLTAQRQQTDNAVAAVRSKLAGLSSSAPQDVKVKTTRLLSLLDQLPQERAQAPTTNTYAIFAYYNDVVDAGADLLDAQARAVSDASASQAGLTATELFHDADSVSRMATLGDDALVSGAFPAADHLQFASLIGSYHASLAAAVPRAAPDTQDRYQQLIFTPAWQQLEQVESNIVEHGGPDSTPVNGRVDFGVTQADWESMTGQVARQLLDVAVAQVKDEADQEVTDGNTSLIEMIALSLFALLVAFGGIVVAFRNSRRLVDRTLVSRLAGLRTDSLHRAHELLPAILARADAGEDIDIESALPPLRYGADEIGQVADAFNVAQHAAVSAAVRESQARKGFGQVLLGIAHRTQVLVHRQLKVIDSIERQETDPDRLDEIFQLDNLVTRARRNSENLIILAGAKPGRRWRQPRRLVDVVRAAAGEIEQYFRVQVAPMPEASIAGAAVGDTIHLLAELLDNATQFSSPRSQVQVYASTTPQGVLIEIEDAGLGMRQEIRDEANELLASQPTFDTITVRGDERLGLFVVASLAHRHGIEVKLRKSTDGGTLAVVVLPPGLLSVATSDGEQASQPVRQRKLVTVAPEPRSPEPLAIAPQPQPASRSELVLRRVNSATGSTQLRGELELPDPASPELPDVSEDHIPPLPQRRRQQHLAPQLRRDAAPTLAGQDDPEDVERLPERIRDNMTAIHRATREARERGGHD